MSTRNTRQRQKRTRATAANNDAVATDSSESSTVATTESSRSKEGFWRRIYHENLAVQLDNSKGSVARDHLANERTFLAWLRTSLSFASAGVGITQLLRLNTTDDHDRNNALAGRLRKLGKPAGALMVVLSLMVICFGTVRYFSVQAAMQKGQFPASRLFVGILSGVTLLVLMAGFFILLIIHPAGRS